jgi:transposase
MVYPDPAEIRKNPPCHRWPKYCCSTATPSGLGYQVYQEDGIEGLASFGNEGGSCRLTVEQQGKLKIWIAAALPRTTREVGAWIARECGIEYQTRSGLIALLRRLGMGHRKPKAISHKSGPAK